MGCQGLLRVLLVVLVVVVPVALLTWVVTEFQVKAIMVVLDLLLAMLVAVVVEQVLSGERRPVAPVVAVGLGYKTIYWVLVITGPVAVVVKAAVAQKAATAGTVAVAPGQLITVQQRQPLVGVE
jgi:hypothetical protein